MAGFGTGLEAALLLRLDNLMLAALGGASELGLYAVAKFTLETLGMVPIILGPMLAASVAGRADPQQVTTGITRRMAWPSLGGLTLMGVTAGWWLPFLFGQPYRPAVPVLQAFLPGVWAYLFGNLWLAHFAGEGNPRLVVTAPLAGLLTMISLNWVVIPRHGAVGAAAVASLGFLVQLTVLLGGLWARDGVRPAVAMGFRPYRGGQEQP
jgi:O-antigen/teichoic acid export membrane protein